METLERFFVAFANYAWGTPLLVLIVGGGIFFLFYSRFIPYRNFKHGFELLSGKYDDPTAPGDINPFQALSSTLAATRSEEHTSELQSRGHLVCRLLLEKKNKYI